MKTWFILNDAPYGSEPWWPVMRTGSNLGTPE